MFNVLISGGTGMIGSRLSKALLQKGYEVTVLSRTAKPPNGGILYAKWDIEKGLIDAEALQNADYIIHLAGANVAEKRWTKKRKKEIIDSRVKSGQLLAKTLETVPNKIRSVISASAIGWYGPDPAVPNPAPFTEEAPPYDDFLGTTCQLWEAALQPVTALRKRLVFMRTGIVLSTEGGAYPQFRKFLHFGVAAVLGNGRQMVSWIHIDDLVQLYIMALENEEWSGAYNAVAPNPVSNATLVKTIAKESGKSYIAAKAPEFVLKIVLGEMSIEVLKSATVSAGKVQKAGFNFQFPTIEDAVQNLEKKK